MKSLEIKPATDADQATLFALYEQLFRGYIEPIWGWDEAWQIENFRKEWRDARTSTLHTDDGLVGYLQTVEHPDNVHVLMLAIRPEHQGKQLGSQVMAMLKRRNMTLRLNVFKINPRALSFYLRDGFMIQEETPTFTRLHWEPPASLGAVTFRPLAASAPRSLTRSVR